MANPSTAFGDYTFDFSNVKDITVEKKADWFKRLTKEIGCGEYDTIFFDKIYEDTGLLNSDEFSLSFSGTGNWNYQRNIEWYESIQEIKSIMLEMVGLKIEINYVDYEVGCDFICKYSANLDVKKDKVEISQDCIESHSFNYKAWSEFDIGSRDEYLDEIGFADYIYENDREEALSRWLEEGIGTEEEFRAYVGEKVA
jgi:hypothetical protein